MNLWKLLFGNSKKEKSGDNQIREVITDLNTKRNKQGNLSDEAIKKATAQLTDIAFNSDLEFDEADQHSNEIEDWWQSKKSSSNKFQIYWTDGIEEDGEWQNGAIGLKENDKQIWLKEAERPEKCLVGNNGVVICDDYKANQNLKTKSVFKVWDREGNIIIEKKLSAYIGDSMKISLNGEKAVFDTHYSETTDGDTIFIYNLLTGKLIKKVPIEFDLKRISTSADGTTITLYVHDEEPIIINV